MAQQQSPEDWGQQFGRVRGLFDDYTAELERLLPTLLDAAGIEYATLEGRTKTVDSFVDKIVRKNEKYDDPLTDMTDLSGVRIILYFTADLESVKDILEGQFSIDWPNSSFGANTGDPDRFGYRSDHYIVSVGNDRSALPEWTRFIGRKAEIQVRTVMQHAWAAVDHNLRYKRDVDVPRSLRRRLSQLSALLEVADEQFALIRESSDELEQEAARRVVGGDFDLDLDDASLRGYLATTNLHYVWMERALALGYDGYDVELSTATDRSAHTSLASFEDILEAARLLDVTNLNDLDEILKDAESWGEGFLRQVIKQSIEDGFVPAAVPKDMIVWLIFGARRSSLRIIRKLHYRDAVARALVSAIKDLS